MTPYYQDDWVTIYHGDCREIIPQLPKVDLVLTDPPYGISVLQWDTVVEMGDLWKAFKSLGACGALITSVQPFTTDLINSNRKDFVYELIWEKANSSNPLIANKYPLKIHENILIFRWGKMPYNPQYKKGEPYKRVREADRLKIQNQVKGSTTINKGNRYPTSVLFFANPNFQNLHPTQKPYALFHYLIASFSNKNNIILDPFLGSGTTCVAAKQLNRKSIGIEIEEKHCEIAAQRCSQEVLNLP